jgi:cyanophycinase
MGFVNRVWIAMLGAAASTCFPTSMSIAASTDLPASAISSPTLGTLVIMGGAVRPDNADIWQTLVQRAGGKGARIAVIPAAASNPKVSGERIIDALKLHGAEGFLVPVAPRLADTDYRKAAQDPQIAKSVRDASGVFFTGGDQSRITASLVAADGKNTALLDAVWAVYRKGGVIAGTSAGAAVMSKTMFYEPPDVLTVLRNGVRRGPDIAAGLNFIGDGIFVDQHLLARGRFARMLPAMRASGDTFGLGVDENTALIVEGGRIAEVRGASGVLMVDTRKSDFASIVAEPPRASEPLKAGEPLRASEPLKATGVRLSYLERGDRVDLLTRIVTPSAFKREGRVLDPNAKDYKPEFDEPRFYADVLGKNTLIEILCNLIDNTTREVIGLAFAAPGAPSPERGFEFRFRKGSDTRGHLRIEQGVAHYTVLDIEMDVAPVVMSAPLYRRAP